jgi:hypothetical protein
MVQLHDLDHPSTPRIHNAEFATKVMYLCAPLTSLPLWVRRLLLCLLLLPVVRFGFHLPTKACLIKFACEKQMSMHLHQNPEGASPLVLMGADTMSGRSLPYTAGPPEGRQLLVTALSLTIHAGKILCHRFVPLTVCGYDYQLTCT